MKEYGDGYRYWKEENEENLLAFDTSKDFQLINDNDFGWQIFYFCDRLGKLRSYVSEHKQDVLQPYSIGDKYGVCTATIVDFNQIVDFLTAELSKILLLYAKVENGVFLFDKFKVIKLNCCKPYNIYTIKHNEIQGLDFQKPLIKYKIKVNKKENKIESINYDIPKMENPKQREDFLYNLCEALDSYYLYKNDNSKDYEIQIEHKII